MKIKFRLKLILFISLFLLYLSGVLTWVLGNWSLRATEFGPEPSPFRLWWLEIHAIIGLLFMILFGYILHSHIRPAWRKRRRRLSGSILTAGLAFLILTVPLLYYAANENLKSATALAHTYIGLLWIVPFAIHYVWRARD